MTTPTPPWSSRRGLRAGGVSLLALCLAVLGSTSALTGSADAHPSTSATATSSVPPTPAASGARSKKPTTILRMSALTSSRSTTRARVIVKSGGAHRPGRVVVRTDTGKVLARGRADRGRRTVTRLTLPALAAGSYTLHAVFRPRHGTSAFRSAPVTMTSVDGCSGLPRLCGYPDSATTGPRAGVTLRKVPDEVTSGPGWHFDERGWIAVDEDGAVVSGITSNYGLDITADDVTVSDSRIQETGEGFGIAVRSVSGLTVEHTIITAPAALGPQRLLVGIKDIYGDSTGLRILRNDISRTSTGVQVESGLIQDNYIHDLGITGDDHVNGITSNGGSDELMIRHNTVLNAQDQTDAISLFQDFGPQRDRWIVDNLVAGGGYTIYAGANPGKESTATDIHVTGNRFSRIYFEDSGYYGPATAYTAGGGNEWSGNVWDEDGSVVGVP